MTVVPADVPGAEVRRTFIGGRQVFPSNPDSAAHAFICPAHLCVARPSRCCPVPPTHSRAKPSLVVIIVVDQMRRDYIQDYGPKWTKGLRRLVDQGAWFTKAAYPYTTTLTCAGHATISTGTLPSTHGIISNQWWDRATQQAVSCTSDSEEREVPYGDASSHDRRQRAAAPGADAGRGHRHSPAAAWWPSR